MKGYYSVMQYCPDASRGEAANVGVVLFTENPPTLSVKTSETFNRVKRFFKPDDRQLSKIIDDVRANPSRLHQSSDDVRSLGELDQFARTMGNDIRLTVPLVVKVADPQTDLMSLYQELVGDAAGARQRRRVILPNAIKRVITELDRQNKIMRPGTVELPEIGLKLFVPYAYQNGVLNYVKPAVFVNESDTIKNAALLAVEGDQIRQHGTLGLLGKVERRLIVVSSSSSDLQAEERVSPIFAKYGVKYVAQAGADQFAERVLKEAK